MEIIPFFRTQCDPVRDPRPARIIPVLPKGMSLHRNESLMKAELKKRLGPGPAEQYDSRTRHKRCEDTYLHRDR
jgi:hypothetical protein